MNLRRQINDNLQSDDAFIVFLLQVSVPVAGLLWMTSPPHLLQVVSVETEPWHNSNESQVP
jgi:hypothetical protein